MTKQQHKKFSAKSTMLAEISEQKGKKSKKNFSDAEISTTNIGLGNRQT